MLQQRCCGSAYTAAIIAKKKRKKFLPIPQRMVENLSEQFFFRKQIQLHCCKRRAYFVRIVTSFWTKITFNLRRLFTRFSTQAHVRQAADIHVAEMCATVLRWDEVKWKECQTHRKQLMTLTPEPDKEGSNSKSKNDDLPLIKSRAESEMNREVGPVNLPDKMTMSTKRMRLANKTKIRQMSHFFFARAFISRLWQIILLGWTGLDWLNFDLYILLWCFD